MVYYMSIRDRIILLREIVLFIPGHTKNAAN